MIIICDAPRPVSVASKGLQVVPTKNLMFLVVSVAGKGKHPKSKSWWWWWWWSPSSSSLIIGDDHHHEYRGHPIQTATHQTVRPTFAKAPIQQPRPRIHVEVYKGPLISIFFHVPRSWMVLIMLDGVKWMAKKQISWKILRTKMCRLCPQKKTLEPRNDVFKIWNPVLSSWREKHDMKEQCHEHPWTIGWSFKNGLKLILIHRQ